jgi:hypothetical protein
MSPVELNDVDIAPLFTWSKEFEVLSNGKNTKVYMRLLGDADMNRARVSALRSSAALRKKLKDAESDERIAYIKDIDDIDINSMIAVIIVFAMRDLTDVAITKLKIKLPKQPKSDAKTSVHEKYQEEVDSYPTRRQEELRDLINKEVEAMKETLLKEDKEVLYKKYIDSMIEEMCEQELLKEFKSQCCYYGTYSTPDLSTRLFATFEEFNNLQSDLKQQFLTEYSMMELQGDDLKKLQQVMP